MQKYGIFFTTALFININTLIFVDEAENLIFGNEVLVFFADFFPLFIKIVRNIKKGTS